MRRLLTLVLVLFCAVPFGLSVAGCSKKVLVTYCDGNDSGPVVGQLTTLTLQPRLTGISVNEGQISSLSTPSGTDCKGTNVGSTAYIYSSSNLALLDIEPSNGRICGGSWNRNTGGGIADYTVCTANGSGGVAYVTASAQGVASNPIPVFVHPVVTSILLGSPSVDCSKDPASNCVDLTQPNACVAGIPPVIANPYTGTSCLSQNAAGQLVARTFAGTQNVSCQVGPLAFSAQNSSIVSIDQNGVATAVQPGATLVNATISNASSSIGSFATCPPASIVLSAVGSTTNPVTGSQNVQQDLVTSVTDTNGNPITNITLNFVSTTPQTTPVAGPIITPTFPGTATITAVCQPPACNPSPVNQIGLFGNGLLATSNPVVLSATGSNSSTVLYVASTNSLYLQPYDFTVNTQGAPLRLPFAPNSLIISTDTNTLYMGSSTELMVFSTLSNQLSSQVTALSGSVIALSPDNSTLVFTDPVRKLIYLYNPSASSLVSEYGGVATHAVWTPDNSTVYITTTDGRLLVYSTFTGWSAVPLPAIATDVALTVPNAGVYLANGTVTGGTQVPSGLTARTDCPTVTVNPVGTSGILTTSDTFYPQSDFVSNAIVDRVSATNDGVNIVGASTTAFSDVKIAAKNGSCPVTFTHSTVTSLPFTTAVPTQITGVLPTSDSAYTLVTYTGTGGVLPQYSASTNTLTNVALQTATGKAAPIAPVAGAVSSDNATFYTGTTGDNLVHQLSRVTTSTFTGFQDILAPLAPNLPPLTGTAVATPNLIVLKPRKTGN